MYISTDLNFEFNKQNMDRVISNKYGIVKNMGYQLTKNEIGERGLFIIYSHKNNNEYIYGFDVEVATGTGAATTKESAIISTIGEHLERYSASLVDLDRVITNKSYRELVRKGYNVLSPTIDLNLYADFQYAHPLFKKTNIMPFTEDVEVAWVEGIDLVTNKAILVPLDFVSLTMLKQNNQLEVPTSSGLACGRSREEAILSGIFEFVERDAFCFHWWTKTSCPVVNDSNGVDVDLYKMITEFENGGGEIFLLDATTDLEIPVYLTIAKHSNKYNNPARVVAASCNLDPNIAIRKAYVELFHTYQWAKQMLPKSLIVDFYGDFDNTISNFEHHVQYYSKDEASHLVDKFIHKSKDISVDDLYKLNPIIPKSPKDKLKYVVKKLADKGFSPIAVDLTTKDLKSIGLHVTRVIVPGLLQLDGPHVFRHWGGERLFKLKKELGYTNRILSLEDLNSKPHPFP